MATRPGTWMGFRVRCYRSCWSRTFNGVAGAKRLWPGPSLRSRRSGIAFSLKIRLWGSLSFADIAIPLIFFTPAQYESLWVTTDFAHGPLPLLLLVLYCLALTFEGAGTRYVLVLIVNFLGIYTGFGFLVGLITPIWLVLEYYARRAARETAGWVFMPLALSLVSLASFFVGYKSEPGCGIAFRRCLIRQ